MKEVTIYHLFMLITFPGDSLALLAGCRRYPSMMYPSGILVGYKMGLRGKLGFSLGNYNRNSHDLRFTAIATT